ncbi:hypothetical protein [Nocardia sp. alder85J]|nr:hypothetical protein [Nocardia sp. alder85J]MCX4099255.1 hypothetical protein [Nocardia sp. alder85J]
MLIVIVVAAVLWGVVVLAIGARTTAQRTGRTVAEIKERIEDEDRAA